MNTRTEATLSDKALRRESEALRRAYVARAIQEMGGIPIIGKYRARGLVFYRIRNRQHARRYVIPLDPRTSAQQKVRAIMRWLSQEWRRLTEDQRLAWIAAGKKVLSPLRLTRGPLTGEMLFIKLNFVLHLLGRQLLLWPSRRVEFESNPIQELMIRREHGRLRLKLRVVGPVEQDILVYGEAPVSARRNKPRHPVFLCLLPAPRGGWSDITEPYVARFGVPEGGKKVIICTRQQRDGWEDRYATINGAVVPVPQCRMAAPRNKRNTRAGLGAGAGIKGLRELLGLPELQGLSELPELPGFQLRFSSFILHPPSFCLLKLPRFPLPAPARAPGRQPVTPVAPRNRPGSTPMCTANPLETAALANKAPNRPREARLSSSLCAPAHHASRPTCPAPRLSPRPSLICRVGPVTGGGRLAGQRRKCHWRLLWRGS